MSKKVMLTTLSAVLQFYENMPSFFLTLNKTIEKMEKLVK